MRWTRLAFILICTAATAAPAFAQTSPQFQSCSASAKTQLSLDKCACGELALRSKQMQSVYSKILSAAAGQRAALAKAKAMQQAWLAYASAYLEALYPASNKQVEYGSMYPMESALAHSALVQRHTADLQGLLTNLMRAK